MNNYDFEKEPRRKKYLLYKNGSFHKPTPHTKYLKVFGYLIICALVLYAVIQALGGEQ